MSYQSDTIEPQRKPEQPSEFTQHISAAESLIDTLRNVLERASATANRALGVGPMEKGTEARPSPVPNGLSEELRMRLQALSELGTALDREVRRLSTLA